MLLKGFTISENTETVKIYTRTNYLVNFEFQLSECVVFTGKSRA